MQETPPIFALEEISISFGGLQAVFECSFDLHKGEIFAPIVAGSCWRARIWSL
jgi:ABC-type branched-subunit amino acid transport system ATPase component